MTKSNVNPDHYKTAGRERQGEDIVQEIHKQKMKLLLCTSSVILALSHRLLLSVRIDLL